jgi:hypothetical protein
MMDSMSVKIRALVALWRQFLPLSLSDVTMAAGDPAITTTLARLPEANTNLGAIGIAKSFAIFFESSIIMLLHASNAMAPAALSRRALARFTGVTCIFLTLCLIVLTLPGPYSFIGMEIFNFDPSLIERSRTALMLLILWPAFIGWRRYFQGLLIHAGHSSWIARAGVLRLLCVLGILAAGYYAGFSGEILAGLALIAGVFLEAVIVTKAAFSTGAVKTPPVQTKVGLPTDMKGVWRFYWPLANSMLVVWGGRMFLLVIIAQSLDASIALAAWPAAWGLVLVIANATRMVQQVIIRNRSVMPDGILYSFAGTVGLVFSSVLFAVGLTPAGNFVLEAFLGGSQELIAASKPVIIATALVPFLVAIQNALQGFLMSEARTQHINIATWLGTSILLAGTALGVKLQLSGATSAAIAMVLSLCFEIGLLVFGRSLERSLVKRIAYNR